MNNGNSSSSPRPERDQGAENSALPQAQSRDDSKEARIGHRHEVAAGLPAVLQTMRFTMREMGPVRGIDQLLRLNQKKGFDCQSCAWPSPDGDRHAAEFCENGVKAVADEATTKRITREFFAEHSIADLASKSDHWMNHQGRLTEPMVRRPGATHYEPIAWNDAFGLIAAELAALASPNEASFYTSGRASNEAAFVYQLFVRQFGTNNLPDCSNMCHESSGFALKETLGVGKGTVTLEDFDQAEAIFIVGQNPGTNHPRMLSSLQQAKKNGCKIVSINPLPETGNFRFKNPQDLKNPLKILPLLAGPGTTISDLWLPVRLSGDMAVFKGISKHMLDVEAAHPGTVLDHKFIEQHTIKYDQFKQRIDATSWEEIEQASGLTRAQIAEAAQIAIGAKKIICCWAMGLTQQTEAVATIQEVVNFLLLGGNIGRNGAGVCPVRGHSNVQGDRTVGVWERMDEKFHRALDAEFEFTSPREHGYDVVRTIEAMHEFRVKVFFALGGNFLSATPDTEFTAEALRKCRLTAHVSTKLNRAHLITGDQALILPCLGRTEIDRQASGEQFVTVEDSMGIINPSRGNLTPASPHLRSEVAIICGLARQVLGPANSVKWEELCGDYSKIRDHIERVIPGFEPYNERIEQGPFYLPNAARIRVFETESRKAVFTDHPLPDNNLPPGQFALMTMRSHDQFNTTIYGLDDRYRGIYNGRRVVFLHADDISELELTQGQIVDLTSHFGGRKRHAEHFMVVPYSIPRRCAAVYFPEGNVLVPIESIATKSGTPVSKFIPVTIAPTENVTAAATRIHDEALETVRV
jgi:molybdopterin-dependent oxidoreductase alpha subunit